MRTISLPSGEAVPAFGLGTWRMGESSRERTREVKALKAGLDLGIRLIDTAEMYGEGEAEAIVGEAIKGRRDGLFVVSKVYPHNASRAGTIAACDRSLKRLGTGQIDLYLLHWPGSHPLEDTVAAFERLKADGKIRHWGVSNFDTEGMAEVARVPGGVACEADQVLYHLGERGIEWSLLPTLARRKMPIMAYSPLGQGAILKSPVLAAVAKKHGVTPAAIAIAWTLRPAAGPVITIPKSSDPARIAENLKGADLTLDAEDLARLDAAFPPPKRAKPLAIL